MEDQFIIYGLVDPRDNRVRYVGKSTSGFTRPKKHTNPSRLKSDGCWHKTNWVNELISLNLKPQIIVLETHNDESTLNHAEKWNIVYYRSLGFDLTNLTDGGDGVSGWKPTAETREKMSRAARGKIVSAETRAKFSKIHSGKVVSEKTRAKLRANRLGKTTPVEVREKISKAGKGRIVRPETRKLMSINKKEYCRTHPMSEEHKSLMDAGRRANPITEAQLRGLSLGRGTPLNDHQKATLIKSNIERGFPILCSNGKTYLTIKQAAKSLNHSDCTIARNANKNPIGQPDTLLKKSGLGFAYLFEKPTKPKT